MHSLPPFTIREDYRRVLHCLPFPAWIKDNESRFLAVNPAFVEIFSLASAKSLIGKTDFDITPSDLAEAYRAIDRLVVTTQQKMIVEEEILVHGKRLWFETYKAPFYDEDGRLLGSIGFARDISERKQAEALREESRERLALALAGGDLGMWDWHIPSGRVVFNDRWALMLGVSPAALEPHIDSWRSRVHPEDRSRTKAAWIAHLRRNTTAYESEHRVRHEDGHWIWILDHGKVLEWDAAGRPVRAVGTHLDITARKESERKLKESEERFRLIHENTGEAIIFAWPDGRIETANPAACALFGLSEEEFRRRGRTGIIDVDDQRLQEGLAKRLRQHSARGELNCIHGSGRRFPAEYISTLFRDSKGELRSINLFRDITARRLQEREQEENRQLLQVALAGADLAMWDWRLAGDRLTVDTRWLIMLGEEESALEQQATLWVDRLHPDDLKTVREKIMDHVAAGNDTIEHEYRLRHRDGHWVWLLCRGKVIERDGKNRPLRIVGTHFDITRRKEAEQTLYEQLHLLRLRDNALAAISQGVLITDANLRITYVNDAFTTITGYSMAEVLGRDCSFLRSANDDSACGTIIRQVMRSGQPFHGEILNYRKDGSAFWNELSITPVFDADKRIRQFVAVLRDITIRRKDEEVRQEQARRIEALSRHILATQEEIRRRLAADLHDWTSPNLAAVSINLSILAEALAEDSANDILERLEDTRALIDDTVAGIRNISAELRPSLLDYAGLVPAMESYAQHFRRRCGVVVQIDAPPQPPRLDEDLESGLFRIFQEALTNVAKHAQAASVSVQIDHNDDHFAMAICDDGIGFEPKQLWDNPIPCGLGLVNMKDTAELSGGSFVIESIPGQGTCLEVRIPLPKQAK